MSPSPHTIPSHASMFTSLLPTEHGNSNAHKRLEDRHPTISEILKENGYRTYMYSANPHVSEGTNYHRGFDLTEHPWQPKYMAAAFRIARSKRPTQIGGAALDAKVRDSSLTKWDIKASGELAQRGALDWLANGDSSRPYFIFLNYTEAHWPYVPPEAYRRRMLSAEQVARSYAFDPAWTTMWAYTFGLHEFAPEDLAVISGTYDATLAELDDLFADLLAALQAGGYLDDTVILLTSDHGENLGDHHMLDHQFAVYDSLVHVPLVLKYPGRVAAGRDPRPVSTIDVFPTLLELAGIAPPAGLESRAISLLAPQQDRIRLSEYPAPFLEALSVVQRAYPTWQPEPWLQPLRAISQGDLKYIRGSNGRSELYDRRDGSGEIHDQVAEKPSVTRRMAALLDEYVNALEAAPPPARPDAPPSERDAEMLRALGYLDIDGARASEPDEGAKSATTPAPP